MIIVVWLLVGIGLLCGALYVIWALLDGLAKIANSLRSSIVNLLGRKSLGITASIPKELQEGYQALPKHDPNRSDLSSYDPMPSLTPIPKPYVFAAASSSLFKVRPEISFEIDIERISNVLSMTSFRPYEPAFAILTQKSEYPERPFKKPQDISTPPSWTQWRPSFADPVFTPPLRSGGLSFLNSFVMEAYKSEFIKVNAAVARKHELIAACEKRNKEVQILATKAAKTFEQAVCEQKRSFTEANEGYQKNADEFDMAFRKEQALMDELYAKTIQLGKAGLLKRIELATQAMSLPTFVPAEGETKFNLDSGIVIHEHRFPDLSGAEWVKHTELKAGWTKKSANQKEKKEASARLYPSLCLRLAAEIARLDDEGVVKAIAINGWADYTEKSTGQGKRAYCASLFATKEQIQSLNLATLEPLEAFSALKGVCARSLELTPIAPIIRLDTNDPRFVDAKEVLSKMAADENLAAMDWENFEHLCRELFERAFEQSGAEVKVTQASRDQGVDAVVFDPDPLRGGKIIIQAKRYTNTVDVSAVRDLYGAVINEGAVKGILVTTSHFGPESYSFAKDKPLTLLNGNELLNLLETHGYKFRINLTEAKALLQR